MRAGPCQVVLLLFSAVVAGMIESVGARAQSLTLEAQTNFQWFSTLGFPDVKGCPCLRVENGWTITGDEAPQIFYIQGFLVGRNTENLTLFTVDLVTRTVTNTAQITTGLDDHDLEILNLRKEADAQIKALQDRPAKDDPFRRFGAHLEERTEVFTLAWACWRQGLNQEAEQLYERAKELPARNGSHDSGSDFREAIEKNVGHAMMWRAIVSFEDPKITRPEILSQCEAILKNYPHSEHLERARQTAQVLKRTIAEDEVHAKSHPGNLDELPVEQQVRELIYRLRDQNGQQFSQPGSCDIFFNWDGNTNTPAHQLVRLGYAAVPQLIAVLDSDTLTRSVGYWRNFVFSHTVLTVGDCAEAILQRITGKSFFVANSTSTYMSEGGQAPAARKAAEAWWADFQRKGEKQALMDAVAAADRDAPAQAEFLCQKYPDVATAALIRGAGAATNDSVRASLIEQLGKLGEVPGVEFLKTELRNGPFLVSRVSAAYELWQRGDESALKAITQDWEKLPAPKDRDDEVWKQIVDFLSGCDSVEAISALANNLRSRPVEVKFKVIEAVGDTERWDFHFKPQLRSAATLEAVEQCLVGSLEDTEQDFNMSFWKNDRGYSDPRICDMAAWFLSERWPNRYSFDVPGSLKTRDRQRIECLNTWRKAHNLAALPLPQNRGVRVGRDAATKVTSIEWTPDSAEPRQAFATQVAALKDKLLDPEAIIGLLTLFARQPEPNAAGLDLKAIKDEDLTGVRVIIRLAPGKPPTASQGWDVNEHVILGNKDIEESSGGGILEAYMEAHAWEDFAAAIKQAVAGAPETPFEISARIATGKNTRITMPTR